MLHCPLRCPLNNLHGRVVPTHVVHIHTAVAGVGGGCGVQQRILVLLFFFGFVAIHRGLQLHDRAGNHHHHETSRVRPDPDVVGGCVRGGT